MKTAIYIETPDGAATTALELAGDYAALIRDSAGDDNVPVEVEVGIVQPEAPQPYACTVVLMMPPDDGQNTRPEDVVAHLNEMDVEMVEWHDEDMIGAVERSQNP